MIGTCGITDFNWLPVTDPIEFAIALDNFANYEEKVEATSKPLKKRAEYANFILEELLSKLSGLGKSKIVAISKELVPPIAD